MRERVSAGEEASAGRGRVERLAPRCVGPKGRRSGHGGRSQEQKRKGVTASDAQLPSPSASPDHPAGGVRRWLLGGNDDDGPDSVDALIVDGGTASKT